MEGEWFIEVLRKKFEKDEILGDYAKRIVSDIRDYWSVMTPFSFCMSEKGDLLSQWRGYANDGTGVSIGFCKEYMYDLGEEADLFSGLKKVIYDEQKAIDLFFRTTTIDVLKRNVKNAYISDELIQERHDAVELSELKIESLDKIFWQMLDETMQVYFAKNPAFEEENEWRIIFSTPVGEEKHMLFSGVEIEVMGNNLKPYKPLKIPSEDKQPIIQIILGPKNKTKISTIKYLMKMNGFENIDVVRSKASYQ